MNPSPRVKKMLSQIDLQLEEALLNLQEAQEEFAKIQNELVNQQAAVMQKQIKVNMLEKLRDQLHLSPLENIDLIDICSDAQKPSKPARESNSVPFSGTQTFESEAFRQDKNSRSPMEMIRSQYKGRQLAEIIEIVLSESDKPLTTSEIANLVYQTKDKDEFNRARNSLSTELRSGAKGNPPKWKKVGRYAYTSQAAQKAS